MSTERTGGRFWNWFLDGAALTVPLVVTILVLGFVVNFLLNVVSPVVTLVEVVPGVSPVVRGLLVQVASLASILVLVVGVGAAANLTEANHASTFHSAIEAVPGVGELYRSFRRMSDVFVESDVDQFQDVKLVEFPQDGGYSLAFVTADTPEVIQSAAGETGMQTLFVPMAPNPVMGGFLVNFAADRIHDVDLTVEEAVQSIVTSGVSVEAVGEGRDRSTSTDELGEMAVDAEDLDGSNGERP